MVKTQYINLNMIPSGIMPVLYCSQYDIGRPMGMVVYNGGEAVDLDSYTCTIEATRTDGTAITAAVTTDDNIGAFATTATMTNKADRYLAKLVLFDSNSRRVASLAFVMCITPATMDENAESIEEDASLYQQYTGTVQTLIADIREDIADLSDHVDVVEDALNSMPFMAERIFRRVRFHDANGRSNIGSQSMTSTASTIICAGRILSDNSAQRIDEYDLSGNLIRTMVYTSSALGHMQDITYDKDRGVLYVAGTGNKVVEINYSDLSLGQTHTVSGTTQIGSVAYENGVLYASGLARYTGVIDLSTWAWTPKIEYSASVTNQNISTVRQGMAAHNGFIYYVLNQNNQIVVIDISTWTVDRIIPVGKGNGTYPYGEIEGVCFVGDTLYFQSAVWFDGYTDDTYDGSTMQIFRTNVGTPLIQHNMIGQATGNVQTTVYVNSSSEDSAALNPNGSETNPFLTLYEACAYVNYQTEVNPNVSWSLQIYPGASHDYSRDVFSLSNCTVYVRGSVGVALRTILLKNCTAFIRQIEVTDSIRARFCMMTVTQVTTPAINLIYGLLLIGTGCTIDAYTLEGSQFFPYAWGDIDNASLTTSVVRTFPYTTETLTSEYLTSPMTVDRYGRSAVLSYTNAFTIPTNSRTTIVTLPQKFRPVRDYVYDLIDDPVGTTLKRIRVYLNANGTVEFFNYSTTISEYVNIRLHLPYITVR